VIDRLFLYIFTTACIAGTCGIILQGKEEMHRSNCLFRSLFPSSSTLDLRQSQTHRCTKIESFLGTIENPVFFFFFFLSDEFVKEINHNSSQFHL
jgi:hypothetical protein